MKLSNLEEKIISCIQLEISEKAYKTWFKNVSIQNLENHTLIIQADNEFAADWIRKNYSEMIQRIAEELVNHQIELKIISKSHSVLL